MAKVETRGVWINSIQDPEASIHVFEFDAGRSETRNADISFHKYAGRTKLVAEFGEIEERRVYTPLQVVDQDDVDLLYWFWRQKTYLNYRDGRGRQIFCVISNIESSDERWGTMVNLELTEVDYVETLE